MKKLIADLLLPIVFMLLLTSCGSNSSNNTDINNELNKTTVDIPTEINTTGELIEDNTEITSEDNSSKTTCHNTELAFKKIMEDEELKMMDSYYHFYVYDKYVLHANALDNCNHYFVGYVKDYKSSISGSIWTAEIMYDITSDRWYISDEVNLQKVDNVAEIVSKIEKEHIGTTSLDISTLKLEVYLIISGRK